MSDLLQEVKERLRGGFKRSEEEWQVLFGLLAEAGSQTDAILRWVFGEHKGYVETRARAGIEFLRNNRKEGWSVLGYLITSSDPDDRDTALAVLQKSGSSRAFEMARPMLKDSWPYLQLDAAEFLKGVFPSDVIAVLRELLNHEDQWVRDAARKQLFEMGEGVDRELQVR